MKSIVSYILLEILAIANVFGSIWMKEYVSRTYNGLHRLMYEVLTMLVAGILITFIVQKRNETNKYIIFHSIMILVNLILSVMGFYRLFSQIIMPSMFLIGVSLAKIVQITLDNKKTTQNS